MTTPSCAALILAAGRGQRFGVGHPKQFIRLLGKPLLCWSVEACAAATTVQHTVVVTSSEMVDSTRALLADAGLEATVCAGGDERVDSVHRGLAAVPNSSSLVAIHDAARPLISPQLIDRLVTMASQCGAAIPALASTDTVKLLRPPQSEAPSYVEHTLDRQRIHLAQTPQVIRRSLLQEALDRWQAAGQPPVTDDAQLIERIGAEVAVVEGDPDNIKVTVGQDLRRAAEILSLREGVDKPAHPRVGLGYDVHRLTAGRKLVLGGVQISHPTGLDGHSDADVLTHAVADALLGAANLGDLGHHFPPDDATLEGISSQTLLEHVMVLVRGCGLQLGNLDAVCICQAPKLAPHLPMMRRQLSTTLGVPEGQISLKATTTERLGFTGREEGIAAEASCLLIPATR